MFFTDFFQSPSYNKKKSNVFMNLHGLFKSFYADVKTISKALWKKQGKNIFAKKKKMEYVENKKGMFMC